jgi:hypothetical protein
MVAVLVIALLGNPAHVAPKVPQGLAGIAAMVGMYTITGEYQFQGMAVLRSDDLRDHV